jgi:hypothetical protein
MPPQVLALARRAWEDRARNEYVGVMVMRRLHGLLVDLNAPMDLQELALEMTLQEQRHTRLCVAAAASLGSSAEIGFDLAELQQARTTEPLPLQLVGMAIGTLALGEAVALRLIVHAIKAVPSSGYRDLLRQIARDEVLHASLGPALIRELRDAAWFPWPGEKPAGEMLERQLQALRARDVVEPDEAAAFEDPASAAALMAVGIPPSVGFKGAYFAALEPIAQDIREALGAT